VEKDFACLDGMMMTTAMLLTNPLEGSLLNFPQIKDLDK
jgi:hypothetical protein